MARSTMTIRVPAWLGWIELIAAFVVASAPAPTAASDSSCRNCDPSSMVPDDRWNTSTEPVSVPMRRKSGAMASAVIGGEPSRCGKMRMSSRADADGSMGWR